MSEYIPIPYPRMLYRGEEYYIVQNKGEELAAREDGWGDYGAEVPKSPPSDPPPEPQPAPKNKGGRPRKNPEA